MADGTATKQWQQQQQQKKQTLEEQQRLKQIQATLAQQQMQQSGGLPSAGGTAGTAAGVPSVPKKPQVNPQQQKLQQVAKAISSNPENNIDEPVNAATEGVADEASTEGELETIPHPSQNDDVTKAQLLLNTKEAVKGSKPTQTANAPVGSEIHDSVSYDERPTIKGRWNWDLENSFMLPKSAWAEEVRKNAEVENQMLGRMQSMSSKVTAAKPTVPSNAAVRADSMVLAQVKELNKNLKEGVYGQLTDEDTKTRYMDRFNEVANAYVAQCEEFGRKPNMSLLYNLYGSNTAEGKAIAEAQQNNDVTAYQMVEQNLGNIKSKEDADKVLEAASKTAAAQANVKSMGAKDAKGIISLAGNKYHTRSDYIKNAAKVELATTYTNFLTEWMYDENGNFDQQKWEQHKAMFDAMGDKLAGEASGDSGSNIADAAKVRMAYMAVHDDERALLLREMQDYEKELSRIMAAAGRINKSFDADANTKLLHGGIQDAIDSLNDKNDDGTKMASGLNKLRQAVDGVGKVATLSSGGMAAYNDLASQLEAAESAHEAFQDAVLKSGSQNPKYLFNLAKLVHKKGTDFLDQYDKQTGGNPYQYRTFDLPSDEDLEKINKEWKLNEFIVNARPYYVAPEAWKANGAKVPDTDTKPEKKSLGKAGKRRVKK